MTLPTAYRTPTLLGHVQIAEKVGIPNLYLHENVEDAELSENTGVIIWPAGVRLGQHLVRNRSQELKGAKVLEVGSGTGTVWALHC